MLKALGIIFLVNTTIIYLNYSSRKFSLSSTSLKMKIGCLGLRKWMNLIIHCLSGLFQLQILIEAALMSWIEVWGMDSPNARVSLTLFTRPDSDGCFSEVFGYNSYPPRLFGYVERCQFTYSDGSFELWVLPDCERALMISESFMIARRLPEIEVSLLESIC